MTTSALPADQNEQIEDLNSDYKILALRVAQSELRSGNTSGRVFMRLSNGSAPLLTSRHKAEEAVSSQLRKELLKQK